MWFLWCKIPGTEQGKIPMIMKRTASVQSILLVHHQAISGTCFALIDARQWEIPLCLQMILRSTIVFLGLLLHVSDIELGSNSELRFPRANKRVDVRSENRDRKYRCRDYFWYSQARPICAHGWKQDCVQSNQYLTRELFSFLEFPMHMGGRSTNQCEGRQTNKQRWIGWMKARATPPCYIHPTSSEQSNTISPIIYSKFTLHDALYSILHTLVSDLHLRATSSEWYEQLEWSVPLLLHNNILWS